MYLSILDFVCLFLLTTSGTPQGAVPAESTGIHILDRHSADVEWHPDGKRISYQKADPAGDGYADVWTVKSNGHNLRKLNGSWKNRSGFPHRHVGGITWHPSGAWFVVVAQNNDAIGERLDELSKPGTGLNCNLWMATKNGKLAWQLTFHRTSSTRPQGVIHPQFSPDGSQLAWAEALGEYPRGKEKIYQWGLWAIKLADVAFENGKPTLNNIRTYQPGKQAVFYETHGFSKDGKILLFCANSAKNQPLNGIDIYSLNLHKGSVNRLTNTKTDWDEHAHYSPDGRYIAWSSGAGFDRKFPTLRTPDWKQFVMLDLWVMRTDNGSARRVTFFNQPGHADHEWFSQKIYPSERIVTSDGDWSPDGSNYAVTVAYEGSEPTSRGSFLLLLEIDKRIASAFSK